MKKRAQITLFVLIAIFIVAAITITSLVRDKGSSINLEKKECVVDSNCVPSSCCHATSCTSNISSLNCSDIFCTTEVRPGTIDEGHCACIDNKCELVIP